MLRPSLTRRQKFPARSNRAGRLGVCGVEGAGALMLESIGETRWNCSDDKVLAVSPGGGGGPSSGSGGSSSNGEGLMRAEVVMRPMRRAALQAPAATTTTLIVGQ